MKKSLKIVICLFVSIMLMMNVILISVMAENSDISEDPTLTEKIDEQQIPYYPIIPIFEYEDVGTGVYITKYNIYYEKNVEIPLTLDGKTVLGIWNKAFISHPEIVNITIPDTVEYIGLYAFYNCSSLTQITLPDSLLGIGDIAFYGCSSLKSVVMGSGLKDIGVQSFAYCKALTEITIPDNVTAIDDLAFSGCTALARIAIPKSITTISNTAFNECGSLVIYGTSPSTAKTYADTHSIPFVDIGINCEYQTYVENIGLQDWKEDGELSGTTGEALRLEGIKIRLNNDNIDVGIKYKTHIQNIGWQDWKADGVMSGTSGQALRMEAIQIVLTGTDATNYDAYYQVHAENYGWLDWAKDGENAGTEGFGYRLEAIRIVVVPADSTPPGATTVPFIINNVYYTND